MQIASLISRCIAIAAIVASSAASAGELGSTSTSSILISVTIPPHLSVREMGTNEESTPGTTEPPPHRFCVLSKGIQTYSVTLMGSRKMSDDEAVSASHVSRSREVSWSDGQNSARLEAGKTASGFKPSAPEVCDRGEAARATLKVDPSGRPVTMDGVDKPLTVIIAAD